MPILVQPFASRSTVSEEVEGLRICVPAKWNWGPHLSCSLALCMDDWWSRGGSQPVSALQFFHLRLDDWWAVGELMVGYTFCTRSVDERSFWSIRKVSPARPRSLAWAGRNLIVGEISDPRFQSEVMAGKSRMPSRIAFDYETKVFGFGAGIEEAEAAELISRIRQRCGIAEASTRQGSGIKFWRPR